MLLWCVFKLGGDAKFRSYSQCKRYLEIPSLATIRSSARWCAPSSTKRDSIKLLSSAAVTGSCSRVCVGQPSTICFIPSNTRNARHRPGARNALER